MFHSGSLLVLPTNIRQGWNSVQVANTLAYYDTAIITAVKSFLVQAAGISFLAFKKPRENKKSCQKGHNCSQKSFVSTKKKTFFFIKVAIEERVPLHLA